MTRSYHLCEDDVVVIPVVLLTGLGQSALAVTVLPLLVSGLSPLHLHLTQSEMFRAGGIMVCIG